MTVTERAVDGFSSLPAPDGQYYPSPAWWLMETGCPADSYCCEECCRAQVDAAWRRHDDKVRAVRMTNLDMDGAAETEGALLCDFCGVESSFTTGTRS